MTVFIALALLGAVATLDGVTVGQTMVSRPLVAGALAGVFVGDPATGLLVGVILESFLLVAVPSGGGRFPEPGAAAVVGAAGAVWIGGGAGLAVGVAAGLVLGQLGALTQAVQRHLNERWVPDPVRGGVSDVDVTRGHLTAIAVDGLRGLVLTAAGLVVVALVGASRVGPSWLLDPVETKALLLLGAFVSFGIMARSLVGGRRWVVLIAGVAFGALAGWGIS